MSSQSLGGPSSWVVRIPPDSFLSGVRKPGSPSQVISNLETWILMCFFSASIIAHHRALGIIFFATFDFLLLFFIWLVASFFK